jgi:hypothetical protein
MADIRKGGSATLADTTAAEFILIQENSGAEVVVRTSTSNTGTIQFAVTVKGTEPSFTNATSYASDKMAFFSVGRNESLWAKASGASQSFSVEY